MTSFRESKLDAVVSKVKLHDWHGRSRNSLAKAKKIGRNNHRSQERIRQEAD